MKRFITLFLISLILTLFISCQPTPEKAIVVNKGNDELTDLIAQTNDKSNEFNIASWQEEFRAYDNNTSKVPMNVSVNATVKTPDIKQFPVVNIKQRDFNKNDLKIMTDFFFQGDIKFSVGQYMTPEEINQSIVEIKQTIYKLQNNTEINSEGTIANLEYKIKQYENNLSKSVEFEKLTNADWNKIKGTPDYVHLVSLNNGKSSSILIDNSADKNESRVAYYENKYDYLAEKDNVSMYQPNNEKSPKGTQITLNKAKELANSVASRLDKDMKYYGYSIRTKEQLETIYEVGDATNECFVLHYTRRIHDAPVTYEYSSAQYSEEYGEHWNYEYMTFYIDDTGIIAFIWDNPKQVLETINSNVSMLTFEEVKDYFKKQIVIKNATMSDYSDYYDYTIFKVSRVELGMTIVKKKDHNDEFMAIPVWDFFGNFSWAYTDKALSEWKEPNKIYQTLTWEELSYLTINAIDGSIIDRKLGF